MYENQDKILLIDDNEGTHKVFTLLFSETRYSIISAMNGYEGLKKFTQHYHEIALVICDLMLPDINGYTLYHNLHECDKKSTPAGIPLIPFLFQTALSDLDEEIIVENTGEGTYFLPKLSQNQEILDKVQSILGPLT